MRIASRGAGVALATAGLVVAAAVPTLGQSQAPGDWPNSGTLKDGSTFTLAPRIAQKLANGEPIGYGVTVEGERDPVKGYNFKRWATALKS